MPTLFINRVVHNGNIIITTHDIATNRDIFVGYSLRQAVKKYREKYNLKHRHLEIITTVNLSI